MEKKQKKVKRSIRFEQLSEYCGWTKSRTQYTLKRYESPVSTHQRQSVSTVVSTVPAGVPIDVARAEGKSLGGPGVPSLKEKLRKGMVSVHTGQLISCRMFFFGWEIR